MKADKIVLVLVTVVMLVLLIGTYLLFTQQEQLSGKKIEGVKAEVGSLSTALKQVSTQMADIQAQTKGYSDSIKNLGDRLGTADAERRDISAKVSDLMKAVDEMKVGSKVEASSKQAAATVATVAPVSEAAATTATAQSPTVDLGQIPVEK